MATIEKEKVMKRIAKLLNLSDSKKNSNEHEAQAALLKAQEMMATNNISMKDLDFTDNKQTKEVGETGTDWMKKQWYHSAVASVIADNFRCYFFYRMSNGMSKIVFMGLKGDAELAMTMYEFANISLEYNAEEYIKEERKVRYIRDSKGIKTDYMKGFIRGLSEKFKEQSKMMISQNIIDDSSGLITGTQDVSMALVLVKDDALVKAHEAMNFKSAKPSKGGRNSAGDTGAYEAGKQKGKNFESASGFIG
jgi:hypothetical protein